MKRLLVAQTPLDLLFKVLVFPSLAAVGGITTGERLIPGIVAFGAFALLTNGVFALAAWWGLRDVARWSQQASSSAATVRAAALAAHRLPGRLAAVGALNWIATVVQFALWAGAIESVAACALQSFAYVLGAAVLTHAIVAWAVAPAAQGLSLQALAMTIDLGIERSSLVRRNALYNLGMTLAPTAFMASLAYAVSERVLSSRALDVLVLTGLVAVAAFAAACAVFVSTSVLRPVRVMSEVVGKIAAQGDVARIARVPTHLRDEVGLLAESVNTMIDRLERVEIERSVVSDELLALARELETRVAERTRSLVEANGALEREMVARSKAELELRQAQKLESVGRLAAGVAHEINTPVQFVSDSVHFVRDAMVDLATLHARYREVLVAAETGVDVRGPAAVARQTEQSVDLAYLEENIPKSLDRALDGLERVSVIVRSMKEFAHPEQKEATPVDLNRAVATTLTIAKNEYKYVADVETELGEVPLVTCFAGEVNQVLLNLVVNAAHAIGDVVKGSDEKGKIKISTRTEGDDVVVAISDTGCGIPEAIRDRIFDPFFTTKEVGKGTGQGLAIARSVIVDKHGGQLSFESEAGRGTTFFVRLPVRLGGAATVRPKPAATCAPSPRLGGDQVVPTPATG